jgi:tRNA1Val (adenine37-N6)-methyltransferase
MATFACKLFGIEQTEAVLKVTTEALILGATAAGIVQAGHTVLDIGTGNGLLPLMIAQKNNCTIHAIDIEAQAIALAKRNQNTACFKHNISLTHSALQQYSTNKQHYDFIVSNPPFYQYHLKSSLPARNTFIHTNTLSFADLASGVQQLLKPEGVFSVLLPPAQMAMLEIELNQKGLWASQKIQIQHRKNAKILRIIATFGNTKIAHADVSFFVIKDEHEEYTSQFVALLKDYYTIF